ncbi:TonB-dependent receptor [Steroidobacter flavus]|uniref:TonB-dependent receptor n=1 Tax=Steroidobacter flavus TaxID=1842136 RepID=A0ABV8SZF3_9GAMM
MSTTPRCFPLYLLAATIAYVPRPGSAAEPARATLEEVIVTAQKREERLIDAPVAITAVGGDALNEQNIVQISDYYSRIPNLQYNGDSTYDLSLRGVTTGGGTNPTLAVLIDDVQFGSSTFFGLGNSRFPDFDPGMLERIEVLRGPQGTLYGASSLGGLLKYVMRKPDPERFFGRVEGGMNTVEDGESGWTGRGSVNIPLASEQAALLLGAFVREDPAYIDNVRPTLAAEDVNDARTRGGQASFLFKPSDNLSITLSGLRQERDGHFGTGIQVQTDAAGVPTYVPTFGTDTSINLAATSDEGTQQLYSGRIEWEVGGVQLLSLTSWGKSEGVNRRDVSAVFGFIPAFYGTGAGSSVSIDDAAETEKFAQEFRVSGKTDRLDWRVGAFYTKEDGNVIQQLSLFDPGGSQVATPFLGQGPISYKEYAGFGDVVLHVTDKFDLQVGARYGKNKQEYTNSNTVDTTIEPVFGPTTVFPVATFDEDTVTWALSPSYHFTPDVMGYARIASGYRPGGPNTSLPTIPRTYDSDSVVNYEVGVKGMLAERIFSFDAALFQIDWKDIQLQNTDSVSQFIFFSNGGEARSRGLELTLGWRPLEGLSIDGNVALLDAELSQALPQSATADTLVGFSGDRLPASAKTSGNLSIQQDFTFSSFSLFVGANWSYVGERKSAFVNSAVADARTRFDLPSYSVVDLRAGATFNDRWHLNLYARNVLDEDGVVSADNRNGTNVTIVNFLQPRTLGMSVSLDF